MRADLGDAMVQISESALRSARVDFELALAWARIHGLTGRDPDTLGEWLLGSGGQQFPLSPKTSIESPQPDAQTVEMAAKSR